MAETIKGINVVIGSDTSGLSAALSDVNKKSRNIQSELKEVEKLLKLDPKNTELLAQKQKLLGDAVSNTSDKLNRLKSVQQQVADQLQRGEISEGQYRAFQREVEKATQELTGLQRKLQDVEPSFDKAGKSAESAADKIKKAGEGISGVGEKMAVGITAPVVAIATLATEGTEEFRKSMARLEVNSQTAGASLDTVKDALRDVSAITGETDSSVEALSNVLAAGFKGDEFKAVLDELSGAAIKFSDTLKLEGLADGLQETLATGAAIGPFAELLERSGVSLDTFNAGLTEASKNGQEQQYVLQQLADLGLSKVNEQYRENNKALIENANAQYDLQESLSELGETIAPIISEITAKISELLSWFNQLDGGVQKVILAIGGIAAVVGPILVLIGKVASAISTIIGLFGSAGAAGAAAGTGAAAAGTGAAAAGTGFLAVLGPIGLIIAAILALVAATVLIVKNWEPIKEFFINLWAGISSGTVAAWEAIREFFITLWGDIKAFMIGVWDGISSYLSTVWQSISDVVKPIFEGIKTFFSGVWEAIKNIFAGALLLLVDLVTGDFENLSKDAQAIWDNLKDALSKIWDGITTVASTAWETMKTAVSTIVNATSEAIKTAWNAILNWFQELPGKLYTIGTDMFNRMREAVTTTITTVKDAIVSGMTSALDWLRGLPAEMLNIGKDMIQGLVDGIKNMMGSVGDAIKGVADKVTGGIRNLLDIRSPSRVMEGLGEYTGEGFAEGIGNTLSTISAKASDMAAAASEALRGTFAPTVNTAPATRQSVAAPVHNSFADMFRGANFSIRNDNDIKLLGQELGRVINGAAAAAGVPS